MCQQSTNHEKANTINVFHHDAYKLSYGHVTSEESDLSTIFGIGTPKDGTVPYVVEMYVGLLNRGPRLC